ncbi:EAL domain-containing protein [Herbaspirillum seropedicae]|uniref:putative bifunctional diguanylate cyclase/phosphodiesterase n=1 Tax=Herbaspirillum seropedicae TaxID=964 RepID=UPI0011221891|nr:EAL domain-containing protein [Herbaspirillum seropedicae]
MNQGEWSHPFGANALTDGVSCSRGGDTSTLPRMDDAAGRVAGNEMRIGVCILDKRGTVVATNGDVQGFLHPLQKLDTWPSILGMYSSKACARNQVSFFAQRMEDASRQRMSVEIELNRALQLGQFCLYYQIQVDRNSRPIGAEALIRWNHPTRGLIGPTQFIPVAEQSSLICAIGKLVIREACKQLKEWEGDVNFGHLVLAVNVSARQFQQRDFVESVCRIVHEYKAPASKLKFELTETTIFADIAGTAAKLLQLREIGVRFSLDDFGVGYSSLLCLHDMPIDQIKIDRSFVNNIAGNAKSEAIVRTLISLSRELGLSVVAEGVEREEQRQVLDNMGCPLQQGYLYNVPQAKKEFLQTVLRLNASRSPLPAERGSSCAAIFSSS